MKIATVRSISRSILINKSERTSRVTKAVVATSVLMFIAPTAKADVGLPLVAVFLPPMWIALAPIVLVEAFVMSRRLAAPFPRAILPAAIGNLVSTLVGIPLAWMLLAVLEMICCADARGLATFGARLYAVTVQAPWLIPYERDFWWMIPCALIVMGVPCFVVSVLIEAPVNQLFFKSAGTRLLWKATTIANACSYLVLGLLIWPAWKITDPMRGVFGPVAEWFAEITFKIAGMLIGQHR
jgi:hypothetical protein